MELGLISAFQKKLSPDSKKKIKRIAAYLPLRLRQSSTYSKWRQWLAANKNLSTAEIQAWQLMKLKEIINFAYHNIPGYRELYRQNKIQPEDITKLEDIRNLPFTTKDLFRDNLADFTLKNHNGDYITTGGSTGIPFGFYESTKLREMEKAFMHDAWVSSGWDHLKVNAILRGAYIGSQKQFWDYDSFRKELSLSSYFLTDKSLKNYCDIINSYDARILQAYPSSLNLLCDLLKDSPLKNSIHFDMILLGSENIYPWHYEKFRKTFPDSKLFGWYGQAEKVIFAPWCEQTNQYHISPFYGYTEILTSKGKPALPNEEGELVGTSFHSYITPFIRYKTMDIAVRGETGCDKCKRNYDMLKGISGRSHEIIATSTGRFISMTAINMHDDLFDLLLQFQFYQERKGYLEFRFLPKRKLHDDEVAKIKQGLMVKLGKDIELSMKPVDEIPPTPSGKFQFLLQKLPFKYGDNN